MSNEKHEFIKIQGDYFRITDIKEIQDIIHTESGNRALAFLFRIYFYDKSSPHKVIYGADKEKIETAHKQIIKAIETYYKNNVLIIET